MKLGSKALAIALLFIALVLVNYLAAHLPFRADATADDIYTLSPGTKSLLGKLEEPVQLEFYFSKNVESLPISYKNFATRVQEMLRQYVRASQGKVQLSVFDPKPDTPEEERAAAAGLSPQLLPTGEQIYFGLVATQADQQKNIPAFTPQREQFLEYDLSQLIYTVQEIDKKKLGLLTSLPLRGNQAPPMMMRRAQPESQFVISEWERTFEIVPVEPAATELPSNLDALAVVHPQNLSPKLRYAIDQFLLSGKPVFIAVDPASQHFKQQSGQMGMFGGPTPNVSSDLPDLLKAYGVTYNSQMVLGDLENAAPVSVGRGQVERFPTWLALTRGSLNATSAATAQLNSLVFVEAGGLSAASENGVAVTPLVQTSDQTGELPAATLGFANPDELTRQIAPSGKKAVALLVQGKLKSAFPNGIPEEAKGDAKPGQPSDKKEEKAAAPAPSGLRESAGVSTLVVIADTDWLMDDFSVRRMNFLGIAAAEPMNDNLAFGTNLLEFLSGSEDLISIRGKGSALRPFTVVRAMEVEANKKYQAQLTALEGRLADVQAKLSSLQGKKTEGNRLVASPEVAKSIEDFRKQEASMRAERRHIRMALREDIEGLGNRLLVMNLLVGPLLLIAFGVWFYGHRQKTA